MYIVFLNPQGNFDKADSFWTEHPDFGGQLVYVKELALAMAKLGHKVDIITRSFSDNVFNVFEKKYDYYDNNQNVRIVRIKCGPSQFIQKEKLWEYLDEWTNNIVGFFKSNNITPDFITSHYGDGGVSGAMLKEKLNIPFSFTAHSLGAQKLDKLRIDLSNIYELDEKYNFSIRIQAERIAIKEADIIFVSTKQEQIEQYSHPIYKDITVNSQEKFIIAPPGANTTVFNTLRQPYDDEFFSKFTKVCQRDIDKSRLGLPYIVLASRLDPKKNHIGLIKAYAKNKELQKMANIAISLRGIENAYEDYSFSKPDELIILNQIMKIIKEYHLNGNVTFISINSQKELASYYRYMAKKLSIFTLTALYEPFGLAPIEAMSSGLPAVVTKYGGPSNVLEESGVKYGVLIDVLDEEDIVRGLKECLDNYKYYQKQGIKRVNENYTWKETAKKYIKAIEKALKNKKHKTNIKIHKFFKYPNIYTIDLSFIIEKLKEMEN